MFKPMSAATVESLSVDVQYPVLCSPKLDGIRGVVSTTADGVTVVLSKKNKALPSVWLQDMFARSCLAGLDGEMIVGDPTAKDVWNKSQSLCMSRGKTPHDDFPGDQFRFHVFDYVDAEAGYIARRKHAEQMVKRLPKDLRVYVTMVPQRLCSNAYEAATFEEEMVGLGYEGIMGRRPDGLYKFGRSTLSQGWLWKYKQFVDAEATILAVKEEMLNTNAATTNELGNTKRSSAKAGKVGKGTLGGFEVEDDQGRQFSVGTGVLTAEECEALWKQRKTLVGKQLTYRSQKTGVAGGLPRFPMFWRWPS